MPSTNARSFLFIDRVDENQRCVGERSPRFWGDSEPPSFMAGSARGAKPLWAGAIARLVRARSAESTRGRIQLYLIFARAG